METDELLLVRAVEPLSSAPAHADRIEGGLLSRVGQRVQREPVGVASDDRLPADVEALRP